MLPSSLFLTALSVQFIYILVNWYFFRRREYVFYLLYILCLSAYFINKYAADPEGIVQLGNIRFSKLAPDKALAILSYVFYFKFGRHFVEAASRYPTMNKVMKYAERVLVGFVALDVALVFFMENYQLADAIFLPVNIAIFPILVYVFKTMIRRNETLDRFILSGSLFYAVCACLTLWMGQNKPPLQDDHIVVLQIGALVEMVLLNAGLVYKSKLLQNQTVQAQDLLIEKYRENQALLMRLGNIRERLARDLHDDIGATLSSVKVYSEILKEKPDDVTVAELIKDNSVEMIERLEVIAWATNPEHDVFKSLKSKMIKFAAPLCHASRIDFSLYSNGIADEAVLPGEFRQNIFLLFKEAINNSVKYAKASKCTGELGIKERLFYLKISDDGSGFDEGICGKGNGQTNMHKRAELIGGRLTVQSTPGKGTTIALELPYPFVTPNLGAVRQEAT